MPVQRASARIRRDIEASDGAKIRVRDDVAEHYNIFFATMIHHCRLRFSFAMPPIAVATRFSSCVMRCHTFIVHTLPLSGGTRSD